VKSAALIRDSGQIGLFVRLEAAMITRGLITASETAVIFGATVIITAIPAHAEEYWGAIAYSPLDGASGVSSQQTSESDARNAAILDCGSKGGSGCETVVTIQRPDCASLVANESLYSWGVARVPGDATKSAMADLGEPGSEVASTCGYVAGTAPATIAPGAIPPAPGPSLPNRRPGSASPAPNSPAPTLR
jgi:Domain of unknown function (DUF4189)